MGVLEDITKMRNEGKSDEEIISELKQRSVSPKEIEDSLNQARIKDAVSDENEADPLSPPQSQAPAPSGPTTQEVPENETYTPSPQYEQGYAQQDYGQYPQYEQEYQEYYPQEGYETGYQTNNTDTMIEISEQVFAEKIKKIKKQLDELNEFKVLFQTKVENALERLKKIENTIDRLQSAILEKVGSYGENLADIKKEMSMMQDSFRKVAGKSSIHHPTPTKTYTSAARKKQSAKETGHKVKSHIKKKTSKKR